MALARLPPRGSPRRYMLFWLFLCCRTLGRLAFRSSRTRSFFSHALMAARKRDDVQSYTDASHFTEEMSCQLLPPALFTTLIRDLKLKVCDRIAGMHMPPIEHALMAA